MSRPRVIIADDHAIVLAGLCKLVEERCEVVAAVEDGMALVEAAERLKPDLIILDISMPLLNGLDAARRIRGFLPGAKLIVLTVHSSATYATEAFKAGADGYLLKQSAAAELDHAIESVLRGQSYLTPAITRTVLDQVLEAQAPRTRSDSTVLTPRQREVLRLVAEGKSAKQVARSLNLSTKTIEFHKTRIMEQLGLHSTPELIRFAIADGLVSAAPGGSGPDQSGPVPLADEDRQP